MIQLSKEEARIVRKRFPHIHMKTTVHKVYAEENPQLLRFLGRGAARKDVSKSC